MCCLFQGQRILVTKAENVSALWLSKFNGQFCLRTVMKEWKQICVNRLQPTPGVTLHLLLLSGQEKVCMKSQTTASNSEMDAKNTATFSFFLIMKMKDNVSISVQQVRRTNFASQSLSSVLWVSWVRKKKSFSGCDKWEQIKKQHYNQERMFGPLLAICIFRTDKSLLFWICLSLCYKSVIYNLHWR